MPCQSGAVRRRAPAVWPAHPGLASSRPARCARALLRYLLFLLLSFRFSLPRPHVVDPRTSLTIISEVPPHAGQFAFLCCPVARRDSRPSGPVGTVAFVMRSLVCSLICAAVTVCFGRELGLSILGLAVTAQAANPVKPCVCDNGDTHTHAHTLTHTFAK